MKADKQAQTFQVFAIYDPAYATPWLLATPLQLKAETVKAIYQDLWPVEQIPLAAKQMIGAQRQFVHADESIQRLPELALLAGSILTFLAASLPATPTGFWDRQPKRTPGRFRRWLIGQPFSQSYPLPDQFRKKSVDYGPFAQRNPGPQTENSTFGLPCRALRTFFAHLVRFLVAGSFFRFLLLAETKVSI